MILLIITILVIGSILIATEKYTNINKAAVAIFVGTLGWILYVCFGADFVMGHHAVDYATFLDGAESSSAEVKQFIAYNVFLKYVGKASEIVLFLLATMVIVEILQNNGCFDFISQLLRTRSSQRMLWTLSVVTFLISANLDNLTTTVMMLTIMHDVVIRQRQRVLQYGVIQMMLFVLGIMLIVGFVKETGVAAQMAQAADRYMGNVLVLGFFTQMLSSVLDSFMSLMTMVSMHDVADGVQNALYAQNGAFWKMMAYASAVGGNIFCIGSVTGLALMKMERIPLGWYAKNVGMVAFLAATAGLVAMYFIVA